MLEKLSTSAGDMGLAPGQGTNVPRAAGQLKHARTAEPISSGTCELQLETSLCTAWNSVHAAMKDSLCCNEDPLCH